MTAWGDVPSWVEAIATSFAFAGTTALLWIEGRRRREERTEKLEAQAAKVAHWLDRSPHEGWELKYRNASEVPVYRIEIHVWLNSVWQDSYRMSRIHPQDAENSRSEVNTWLDAILADYTKGVDSIWVDLIFVDANGQGWVRDIEGFLRRLDGQKAHAPLRLSSYKTPPRLENEPVIPVKRE